MAIKVIINNTEKEIEQIKNSNEQDIDYVYSRIGDTEVEGEPPISIKSVGGNLADYRIYGQTVDGESVGDRTGNLFDGAVEQGSFRGGTGDEVDTLTRIRTTFFSLLSAGTYTINATGIDAIVAYMYTDQYKFDIASSCVKWQPPPLTFSLSKDRFVRFAFKYNDDSNISITDISQIMLNSGSTALPYEPYGYKVPMTVKGKNLLPNTATSQTINGVTFTINNDKSVTVSGTATNITIFDMNNYLYLDAGTYILSGCVKNGSDNTYRQDIYWKEMSSLRDFGNGLEFTLPENIKNITVRIVIFSGTIMDNVIFYPMIRKADITDDTYEPYHAPVTTPIYLPEQIRKVGDEAEYIDYGEQKLHRIGADDINVTLPALSTIKGTNTLSVNTSIQPSNMYIKDNFDYKKVFTAIRTIEGESPLNYRSIEDSDSTLNNYRIYGQTVDRESVGDRTGNLFDEAIYNKNVQDNMIIYVPIYVGNIDYVTCSTTCPKTIYSGNDSDNSRYIFIFSGNVNTGAKNEINGVSNGAPRTIQPSNGYVTIAYRKIEGYGVRPWEYQTMLNEGSTALPYEPYGYKVPVTVEGKNLLQNIATSQTIKGVTFTVNSDGSIVCDGQASPSTATLIYSNFLMPSGTYILTGCPNGGSERETYKMLLFINGEWRANDMGSGANFTLTKTSTVSARIDIYNGYTCDNLTFYPMIRKADIEDDTYEPYQSLVTTLIYLPEPIKMVGDEAEYVDYAEQKQHRVRKNLLQNTATSRTINGVTFTVNEDGSVTCNGTASAVTYLNLNENFNSTLYAGAKASFYQSGQQPAVNTYIIRISKANRVSIQDFTMNDQVIIDNGDSLLLAIRINKNYTCDNLTFYPMIRKADIEDDTYEPYIENTEVDVNLPALPTQSSTNTLSVGTEIEPSNIYIKGKIKSLD